MKSSILPRGDWSPLELDSHVSEGAETNELSVLLRLFIKEARNRAKTNLPDTMLLHQKIQSCFEYLAEENIKNKKLQIRLDEIAEVLKEQSLISSLLELPDKDTLETLSITFKRYSQLMVRFKRFNRNSREQIVDGLKRDLFALKLYVDQSSSGSGRSTDSTKIKKYVPMFSFYTTRLVGSDRWRSLASTYVQKDTRFPRYRRPVESNTNQIEQYVLSR